METERYPLLTRAEETELSVLIRATWVRPRSFTAHNPTDEALKPMA
ncbi:MAG: hypothetical protein IT581_23270 [Verrucomicrobiales bacterium]|nr:hypothetical protein [Verrucomicrobiales bacterium]